MVSILLMFPSAFTYGRIRVLRFASIAIRYAPPRNRERLSSRNAEPELVEDNQENVEIILLFSESLREATRRAAPPSLSSRCYKSVGIIY